MIEKTRRVPLLAVVFATSCAARPAAAPPTPAPVVHAQRLFGITDDGWCVIEDAGQLHGAHVSSEKRVAISTCAQSCAVEIRGRSVLVRTGSASMTWSADRGASALDDDAASVDRIALAAGVELPRGFATVSSYPESIFSPDGAIIYGQVNGELVAVPLDRTPASRFGQVPRPEEAIRGKAGWRVLLATRNGAVVLEKTAVTFWNARARRATKLDSLDQRELVAGLVAVSPDESRVLYVAEHGVKIAAIDGSSKPIVVSVDGGHADDMRPIGGPRVVVCDHHVRRDDEHGTCDLAILDAETGVRTPIADGVRASEDVAGSGLGRAFAIHDGRIAFVTARPGSRLVVAPLRSATTR